MKQSESSSRFNGMTESDNKKMIYVGASIAAFLMAAAAKEPNGWILAATITNLVAALVKCTTIDLTHITEED